MATPTRKPSSATSAARRPSASEAPGLTSDEWDRAFREASLPLERRPEGRGWVTSDQLQERFGVSRNATLVKLKRLLAAGKVERFVGSVLNATGRFSPQVWWRLKR